MCRGSVANSSAAGCAGLRHIFAQIGQIDARSDKD